MDNISIVYIVWVFVVAFVLWYFLWKMVKYLEIRKHRKDAVKRSKSVILWESYEKLAPFMMDMKYNPKDMNFLWKWTDYIIFDGLSSWKLEEIVLLEIKTWKSSLNKNERQIQNIVNNKKVRYEVIYLDKK